MTAEFTGLDKEDMFGGGLVRSGRITIGGGFDRSGRILAIGTTEIAGSDFRFWVETIWLVKFEEIC
jgi:hypothetical protein